MRNLASIKRIDNLVPIDGADFIEAAEIGGWKVVVKKGEFKRNDLVIFAEIDSFLPEKLAPFLADRGSAKIYEGVTGFRIKSAKIRKCISQGLILSIESCDLSNVVENQDVTETLGVLKYEKPIFNSGGPNKNGEARGSFPSFLRRTDEPRVQNLKKNILEYYEYNLKTRDVEGPSPYTFEVTEKLDGTSCTIYNNKNVEQSEPTWFQKAIAFFTRKKLPKARSSYGVCSRNIDLKESESNVYWKMAREGVLDAIFKDGRNLAVQGEIVGEKIGGNQYKIVGQKFYVFNIYDIDNKRYFTPGDRDTWAAAGNLNHVPIIDNNFKLADGTIDALLTMAEGESKINKSIREGLVFKCHQDPSISFKAISNKWLLKYED